MILGGVEENQILDEVIKLYFIRHFIALVLFLDCLRKCYEIIFISVVVV